MLFRSPRDEGGVLDEELAAHPEVEEEAGVLLEVPPEVLPAAAHGGDAAAREAREESGIAAVDVGPAPIAVDRHAVPCAGGMSEHLDVQYLAVVPNEAREAISAESDDLRWFALDALPDGLDASVLRQIHAAADIPSW